MKRTEKQIAWKNRLSIKNRTTIQWFVMLVSFWSFLFMTINVLPGPLSYLKYLPDGILALLLIMALRKKRFCVREVLVSPLRLVVIFFSFCLVVSVFRHQSVAYFLWGFRNNFRFYIAFFAFIAYLDELDVETWFKALDILFWINAALSAVQFFVLGLKGDFLGGIFGVLGASNGYSLCLMSIVVGKSLLDAFSQKKRFFGVIIQVLVAVFIATMAEMKFFFFIVAFLTIGASMITGFSGRKLAVILLCMVALSMGATYLVDMFGFEDFFSLEKLWESATQENYSSSGDINRLVAIESLVSRLNMTPLDQVLGYGLGNCDTSAFAFCNTPFYVQYGHLHYTWFTSAMLFLETGCLGMVLYISFFCICGVKAFRNQKKDIGNLAYNRLAFLMSILCVVMVFYDSSLRVESGYMMYFVLALPFFREKVETPENA